MELITVITPTYNRASLLLNLFESLKQQERDFKWLIVDDGSNDDTEKVVGGFKADFNIKYIKKENGGKHTALNVGIREIDTELTIIVDSDDTLLPSAIQDIKGIHEKYRANDKIGAYSFLRCYSDGKPVVPLDKGEFIDNYIKYRIKEHRPGDMAEVFNTKVLQEYPFPEFAGERFLSEDIVWIEISKKYDFVFINKAIYECEYLEGGLTANDKPMKFASPIGSMLRGKRLMSKECGLMANIRGAIIYNCYNLNSVRGGIPTDEFREKLLVYVTKPLGWYYRRKWQK